MYNRSTTAEILGDLRDGEKERAGKKPTYKELSDDIKKTQSVYISDSSLCDYENIDKDKEMSVKNFVALADYYDVSYDYLLGKSESKNRENIDINVKYGLSDKALARLEIMKASPSKQFETGLIETFNAFVESDEFGDFIDTLAKCRFAREVREGGIQENAKYMAEVDATLTEEQRRLSREGKLILVQPIKYFDVLISMLQNIIPTIAVEMFEPRRKI